MSPPSRTQNLVWCIQGLIQLLNRADSFQRQGSVVTESQPNTSHALPWRHTIWFRSITSVAKGGTALGFPLAPSTSCPQQSSLSNSKAAAVPKGLPTPPEEEMGTTLWEGRGPGPFPHSLCRVSILHRPTKQCLAFWSRVSYLSFVNFFVLRPSCWRPHCYLYYYYSLKRKLKGAFQRDSF